MRRWQASGEAATAVILALLVLTLASACGPGSPAAGPQRAPDGSGAPAQRPERTVVIAVRVEPFSLAARPLHTGAQAVSTSTRLFNAGFDLVDDRSVARPYLAEALPSLNTDTWQVFPDGRMVTSYRMKPDLTWHDGASFAAEDFVLAWRVYSTPEFGAAGSPPLSHMEDVAAPDPRTVVIRWRRPYPHAGVQAAGNFQFPPLPRHVLAGPHQESQPDAFAAHPYWTREFIGLGPYRLESWEPGTSIEGVAFEGHVLGRPRIERIKLLVIADSNTALANLLAGSIHMAVDNVVGFQQGIAVKREWEPRGGGSLVVTTNLWRATFAQFRSEMVNPRAILDLRVRKALAQAVDKRLLNDVLYEGEGIMTDSFIPPSVEYYSVIEAAIAKYPYDPRRSEQLMADAGFSKGVDGYYTSPTEGRLTMELKVNAFAQYESERSIMASGWRQAGFDIQETVLPASQAQDGQARASFPALYSYSTPLGEGALANFGAAGIPRPETRWTGNNRGAWSSPEYERAMEEFDMALDRDARVQLLSQLTRLVSGELPAISLYYDLGVVPHVASLSGPGPVSPDATGKVAWNVHGWELR